MKNIWSIAKKELGPISARPSPTSSSSPSSSSAAIFFYSLVCGSTLQAMQMAQNPYYAQQINVNQMVFSPLFHNMALILILLRCRS